MSSFGDRLAEARKAAGLTQSALAERLSVSVRAIQQYEQGSRIPPLKRIKQIADELGVNLSFFDLESNSESQRARETTVTPMEQEFLRWIKENVSDVFFYEFDRSPEESKEQLMKDLRYMWEREKKTRGEK